MILKGKWALVTGSTRGIGQQIVYALAKCGCNVVIHGRKTENATGTLDMIEKFDVKKIVIEGELSSRDGVKSLIDSVEGKVGMVDILYNNAGIQNEWKEVFDITIEEWYELFQINLFAVVELTNRFMPKMIEKGEGAVICTTSGIEKIPQMLPYAASKYAIDKFVMDFTPELEGTNVGIYRLDPGWLRTDLGGPEGEHSVESVIPGALAPLLLDFGKIENGTSYHAHDYTNLEYSS